MQFKQSVKAGKTVAIIKNLKKARYRRRLRQLQATILKGMFRFMLRHPQNYQLTVSHSFHRFYSDE